MFINMFQQLNNTCSNYIASNFMPIFNWNNNSVFNCGNSFMTPQIFNNPGFTNVKLPILQATDNTSLFSNNFLNNFNLSTFSMPQMQIQLFSNPLTSLISSSTQTQTQTSTSTPTSTPTSTSTSTSTPTPTSTPTSTTYKIGKFNLEYWKSQGYNQQMGQKLAMDAFRTCPGKANGQCVGYTRKTLNRIYNTSFSKAGAAYRFGSTILSHPSLKGKFKKVSKSSIAQGGIPDGAIVIWKPGAPGYTKGKAALYGHGGIAYQNKVYSDCIVKNLNTCCEVWIPV